MRAASLKLDMAVLRMARFYIVTVTSALVMWIFNTRTKRATPMAAVQEEDSVA
jgi:hypothetical protein